MEACGRASRREDKKNALNLRIADAMFRNKKPDEAEGMLVPLSSNKDLSTASLANILSGTDKPSVDKHRRAVVFFRACRTPLFPLSVFAMPFISAA